MLYVLHKHLHFMIYHIDVHVSDPLTKAHSAFCNTYQHEQELCGIHNQSHMSE